MSFSQDDRDDIIKRYCERLEQYGYSPKTLGWTKDKQNVRFNILTSLYDFNNKSVLDIGCGFGDLNRVLRVKNHSYHYLGIDIVGDLIQIAKSLYANEKTNFEVGNFLDQSFNKNFDYIIACGIFNHKLRDGDNYSYIESTIKKALSICNDGIAFDFLSDKVNFKYDHTFHSSPERVLSIAYKYSRNVVVRNDYMPFEFSLFVFKDDSFSEEDTIFGRYKNESADN